MFRADLPISSLDEDLLERRSFSESLGNAILNYKENDSIVIGLYGSWGSGKTSVINMTLEFIRKISKNNSNYIEPIIIRFNPWSYSDQYQLVNQFFSSLSNVLKRKDYSQKAQKAGEKLATYANFFSPLSYIPPINPIIKSIKGLGSSIKKWGELKAKDLDFLTNFISRLTPTTKQTFGFSLESRNLRQEYFPPCVKKAMLGVGAGLRNYAITMLLTSFISYARIAPTGARKNAKISDYIKDISARIPSIVPFFPKMQPESESAFVKNVSSSVSTARLAPGSAC